MVKCLKRCTGFQSYSFILGHKISLFGHIFFLKGHKFSPAFVNKFAWHLPVNYKLQYSNYNLTHAWHLNGYSVGIVNNVNEIFEKRRCKTNIVAYCHLSSEYSWSGLVLGLQSVENEWAYKYIEVRKAWESSRSMSKRRIHIQCYQHSSST